MVDLSVNIYVFGCRPNLTPTGLDTYQTKFHLQPIDPKILLA